MSAKRIGVMAVLLASVMWAIEPILAKLSYQNSDFLQTSAVRAIFVTLTALVYTVVIKRTSLRINKRQFPVLAYIAIVGTLFADLMYFYALKQVPVVNAVLIGHMQPVFIILIGFLVLKGDRLTKFDCVGIVFMMISGLLVTSKTVENLGTLRLGTLGDLLVLSSTIAWATTAIAMRKYLKRMNAGVVTFYRFFLASIVFSVYLISNSVVAIANIYQILVGIAVGAGTILYYEGLKRIKAAQVSAIELSAPFFAAVLGFVFLGELLKTMQIVGIVCLFVGIYCLSKKEKVKRI